MIAERGELLSKDGRGWRRLLLDGRCLDVAAWEGPLRRLGWNDGGHDGRSVCRESTMG